MLQEVALSIETTGTYVLKDVYYLHQTRLNSFYLWKMVGEARFLCRLLGLGYILAIFSGFAASAHHQKRQSRIDFRDCFVKKYSVYYFLFVQL